MSRLMVIGVEEVIMTKADEWKLLIATSDESEAHLLRNKLASEGIRCKLRADNTYPGYPHGGRTREIQVFVPAEEFEVSQQVVEIGDLEEDIR
jgi:hypothetical protein